MSLLALQQGGMCKSMNMCGHVCVVEAARGRPLKYIYFYSIYSKQLGKLDLEKQVRIKNVTVN